MPETKKKPPPREVTRRFKLPDRTERAAETSPVADILAESRAAELGNQPPELPAVQSVTQTPNLDAQIPKPVEPVEPELLVTQTPNRPNTQYDEKQFRSRIERRQKSIRLPVSKLERYEDWQHANRKRFPDFQDLVEYALDWVTKLPDGQIPNLPDTQPSTLITNDLNNLIINDEKAKRALGRYSQVAGRPATAKDLEAYREVAQLPIEAIEQGIDETKRRAGISGRQFNGFRYALNVIREVSKNVQPAPAAFDYSECPDCFGTTFEHGAEGQIVTPVKKCKHPRLEGK